MKHRKLLLTFLALPLVVLLGLVGLSWASARAPLSGLVDGRLRPCPETPNCVSSQSEGAAHVPPLTFRGSPEEAFDRLLSRIDDLPRTELLAREEGYAHFEFTTRLLRFRDDVELQLAPEEGVIHVRSASRVGHSDMGANRARVEGIRAAWLEE